MYSPRQQRLKRCLVKIVEAGQPLDFAYPTEAARKPPLQRPPAYWCWRPLGVAGWSGTVAAGTACRCQHSGRFYGTGGWMGYGVGLHRPWMILDLKNTIIWIIIFCLSYSIATVLSSFQKDFVVNRGLKNSCLILNNSSCCFSDRRQSHLYSSTALIDSFKP